MARSIQRLQLIIIVAIFIGLMGLGVYAIFNPLTPEDRYFLRLNDNYRQLVVANEVMKKNGILSIEGNAGRNRWWVVISDINKMKVPPAQRERHNKIITMLSGCVQRLGLSDDGEWNETIDEETLPYLEGCLFRLDILRR